MDLYLVFFRDGTDTTVKATGHSEARIAAEKKCRKRSTSSQRLRSVRCCASIADEE